METLIIIGVLIVLILTCVYFSLYSANTGFFKPDIFPELDSIHDMRDDIMLEVDEVLKNPQNLWAFI